MTRRSKVTQLISRWIRKPRSGGQESRAADEAKRATARRQLLVEGLETRRLLAAATDLASITGRVFKDTTGNGYTAGEEVSSATVNLYRDDGDGVFEATTGDTFVRATTTSATGTYRFDSLTVGDYFIQQPAQTAGGKSVPQSVSPLQRVLANDPTAGQTGVSVQGQILRTIDDFDTTAQQVADTTNDGIPVTSSLAAPATEVIGGERDLLVNRTSTTGSVELNVNNALLPGILAFDSRFLGQGQRVISWDGVDNDATRINDAGLAAVDLTSGGTATGFRLQIGADLAGGQALLRVYSNDNVAGTANRFSSFTVAIPQTGGAATALEYVPFTSFVAAAGGGADFTQVGAIEMEITGAANVNGSAELVGAIGPNTLTQNFANFETADLSLTQTVSSPSPAVGSNVTFTLTVLNGGPNTATNVKVTDLLPSGLTYVSSTPSTGTYDPITGLWSVGSLNNGSSATLQIVATVASGGSKTNIAQITSSDQNDPDSTPNNSVATEDDQSNVVLAAAVADLRLSKTASTTAPNINQDVTFTITVNNDGPNPATNVSVLDQLPTGLTFISSSTASGVYNSATGVWTVGGIANAGAATLQIVARVNSTGQLTNSAQISASDQSDPDSTPNNSVATEDDQSSVVLVTPQADLSVTQTVSTASPSVNQNVTFTITVANAGPSNATGVSVRDELPAGLTFVSSTPSVGTFAGGVWTIGALNTGVSATLQITARVDSIGAKINVAELISSNQLDPDSTPNNGSATEDDRASVTITPQVIDLSLTKTVNQARPNLGENITFTLTVANAGPSAASGVVINDVLPAGLTFVSSTPTQGTYDQGNGNWAVGNIAVGSTASLAIVATVTNAGSKTNTAEVTAANQTDSDSTPANGSATEDDRASVSITPAIADLALTKTVSNASPSVGQNVTFTVRVSNTGPDPASGVVVKDLLPTGMTFVSSTATTGTYDSATGLWTVGSLANAGTATLQIVATPNSVDTKTNTAEVTATNQSDPDSTPNNNIVGEDDQASVVINPQQIDLSVTKTVDNPAPNRGQNATFTITVTNAGPSTATGVALTDRLPTGLTFVSASPSIGSFAAGTRVWTVGNLASGASATLTLVARANTTGAITNVIEVTAANQSDVDSTPNNSSNGEDDQASITINVPIADLSLTKTADTLTPNVNQNVTFTLTVSNAGGNDATGVQVTDILPAGLVFDSSAPSQGTFNSATGVWNVGDLINGATASLQLVAKVTTTGAKRNNAQITAVAQADPDSTPNNNVTTEDDYATITVTPQIADLSLTKTVNQAKPNVGEEIAFTIRVANAGPQTATNVAVTDLLPTGMAFVSSTPTQGAYDSTTGIWTIGSVASGSNATLVLNARATTAGAKVNVAEITAADQFDPDSKVNNGPVTEDDRASVTVTPAIADLSIRKVVNDATPDVGDNVTFTITLTNNGPDAAPGITVRDTLPASFIFVSATPNTGTFDTTTGVWTVGTLASAGVATLKITATTTVAGDFTNTAEVLTSERFDPDSTPGNGVAGEDDQASVVVSPEQVDLSLTKTVDNTEPNVNTNATYTITVNNAGPSAATGVKVTDKLPSGLSLLTNTPSQGLYNATTGVWNIGRIASGSTVTLVLVARVLRTGNYVNTAEVTAQDQIDVDSKPANGLPEDDIASIAIDPPQVDITIKGAIDKRNPVLGDDITFTYTIRNLGPDNATVLSCETHYRMGSGTWVTHQRSVSLILRLGS